MNVREPVTRFRTRRTGRRSAPAVIGVAMALSVAPVVGVAEDGNALWRVVHHLCVSHMRFDGHPEPCTKVDLPRGYAVVKDLGNPTQLLLVPTARVTGIEDARLLAPGSPNYWQMSWENRYLLEWRAKRPLRRDEIGMVVNSMYARSEGQLHIHIDCVDADVGRALAAHRDEIGPAWRVLDAELSGRTYAARWIPEAALGANDPFKLLAELPAARSDMGRQTLVLVGATSSRGEPGFILLNDQANAEAADFAHGEDLLDHACPLGAP